MKIKIFVLLLSISALFCCGNTQNSGYTDSKPADRSLAGSGSAQEEATTPKPILTGADRTDQYIKLFENKTIALMVNHTSTIGEQHLVDSLVKLGVKIKCIFAPEHGFRGKADAGETLTDGVDAATGISLISLYGKKKEPDSEDLKGVDLVVFDIQDVGTRFFTYISSMHYLMNGCAKLKVPFLVLDRPNPNGHYIDGPILEEKYKSFVGMHPIPIVHGMTIGEYAEMVNGEGWLDNGQKVDLQVIPCLNYDHSTLYELPIKPSPNLPNMQAIYLYPSTCFFEGTIASEGRGTDKPFQVYGHPDFPAGNYEFTPKAISGATNPKLKDKLCKGFDLSGISLDTLRQLRKVQLEYVIDFYNNFPDKANFFLKTNYFDKLAGTESVRKSIIAGKSAQDIRTSWATGLNEFQLVRKKYLKYPDFN